MARRKSVNKYRRKKVSGKKKARKTNRKPKRNRKGKKKTVKRKNRRKRGGNNGFLYDENDYIYGGSDVNEKDVFEEQSGSQPELSAQNDLQKNDNTSDKINKDIDLFSPKISKDQLSKIQKLMIETNNIEKKLKDDETKFTNLLASDFPNVEDIKENGFQANMFCSSLDVNVDKDNEEWFAKQGKDDLINQQIDNINLMMDQIKLHLPNENLQNDNNRLKEIIIELKKIKEDSNNIVLEKIPLINEYLTGEEENKKLNTEFRKNAFKDHWKVECIKKPINDEPLENSNSVFDLDEQQQEEQQLKKKEAKVLLDDKGNQILDDNGNPIPTREGQGIVEMEEFI